LPREPLADPAPLIRRVYAYVAYRIGDGPDAEDVTSEVFERALRFRASYDAARGEPAAWLIGIARRCIVDAAARRQNVAEPLEVAAPGDLAEQSVRRLVVRDAVHALGDRDRELIALRYGADLTAGQIGRLLGMRTNAVEVALHRALGRLRAQLGEPEDEAVPAALRPVRI
jgi:RNA polymerase sigma-70 factor (ECF subfamily)